MALERAGPRPYAVGGSEDVVHPKFGEGVVTGLEPGGIVVIRFSRDGSERKMLSQYAHLTRR